ncbi:kinetochore-associated protein 1 [Trichonephila inaurata madagascariensis]|uniref:Kinetochore-associated protein 1 n=1 Tax=Trichonephila inaurata madagascariensis TaxID=2747483 RepID=A0A8X6YB74_9ARAC|nr:kinetochore-associated protein 1 [Trichonephila inaurata madagascariensis]
MCSFTSIVCKTWNYPDNKSCIIDFVMNETVDPSSFRVTDCKIGLLIELSENSGHIFEIRTFPSFQKIFNIDLLHFVRIVECKPNQDFWYVIDGAITFDDSGQKYLNDFSLKAVFEALPEAKLMNLISQRKFLEAEKLAELSNLNSEVIYTTKINCILNNLSMNKYDDSSKAEMDNMWNELEEAFTFVKDVEFIRSVVLYPLSDANHIKNLFLHVKTWLINHNSMMGIKEKTHGSKKLARIVSQNHVWESFYKVELVQLLKQSWPCTATGYCSCWINYSRPESDAHSLFEILTAFLVHIANYVNQVLNKLITYEMLSSSICSCLILKDFLNKDLLSYMISELKVGNINTVFIIWQRHKDELLMSINVDILKEIISAIQDSVSSKYLIPFLCDDFLPSIFSRNPDFVDMVAEWLIHRVYLIELSEKDCWPKNGLALVTGFFKVIEELHEKKKKGLMSFSASLSLSKINKKIASTEFHVGCLAEFSKDLTWLMTLKSNFSCKISLSDFKESKMDVIFAVLDRVNLLVVPKVIEEFARPYAMENDIELDLCLERYIKHTLETSCFTWWSWDEEPWEERLIAVLESILSVSRWANAALMIVGRASVPWSEKMQKLVKKGVECDCKRKEEFQMQSKLVGLKEVLLKYDMKSFPINKDINLLYVLINYIFKQNRLGVLEDVKKVLMSANDQISESNIYYKYLQLALSQNKVDHMIEIFLSLSQDVAVTCASRLLQYIKVYLDDKFLLQNQKELQRNTLYAAVYLIEFLKKSKKYFVEEELLIPFRSLMKLEEEFGICMTFSEITSKSRCKAIIESAICDFLTEKRLLTQINDTTLRKHLPISSNISRLNRLGDILFFEREEIMALLVTNCLQEQKYDLVLQLCKEMTISQPTCETAQIFLQVAEHFCINFRSIKVFSFAIMIDTIHHFASMAVTYCKEDLIEEYMQAIHLSSYLSSIKDISGQHSSVIAPEFSVDSYHKWKFYPFYCDEGFQLDCESIIDYVMLLSEEFVKQPDVTFAEIIHSQHNGLLEPTKKLVGCMTERGYGIAALRTLFYYYHLEIKKLSCAVKIQEVYSSVFLNVCSVMVFVVQRALIAQFNTLKFLLEWSTRDLNRLTVVAKIGMELAKFHEKMDALSMYENIYKKAYLLSRNNIKSVNIEAILSSSHESNWSVVKDLIYTHHIDLPTVFDCSSAFQLQADRVLILYLNSIFKECEKKYLDCESMDFDISPTLRRAETVIKSIRNEELLYNNFQSLMKEISPYSYDILLFIIEQLHSISADIRTINSGSFEKDVKVLKFLKVYERTSPVTELEQNEWVLLHPTIQSLRQTLDVWLKIAVVLRIPEDHLIIMAVKNSVVNYLNRQHSPHVLLSPDTRFVNIIHNIIGKIKVLESSVACASWVANIMPPGGNKVWFYTIAVNYAQQWYKQSSDSVVNVYNKLIYLKQQSAVERILYKNNLAADEILSLKRTPLQLIEDLIENFTLNIDQSIKACKAALEIGEVLEIDLTQVLWKHILKWSNVSQTTSNNLDETFSCLSPVIKHWEDDDDIDEKNTLRLINLLLSLPESIFPSLYQILKDKFEMLQKSTQARLLFCFVAVFDVLTVSKAVGWDAEILEANLIPLKCGIELQNLNLPYSFQMFNKCSKTELVQNILSNYFNNPKAVVFCIQLCLEYNIWNAAIWEAILQRLTAKFKDYSLQDIIQSTQGHLIHLWHSEAFINSWKCILSGILRIKVSDSSSTMAKLYKTILRCPCISSLDVNFFSDELSVVIQTFDDETMKEMEPITNMPSFVTVHPQIPVELIEDLVIL